jgi:hypothetical protein
MPKCVPSPGSVKSKFCIMQPSRERTTVIVHTRISYPNPERVRDTPWDLMHLLYEQKARISYSPMFRNLKKKKKNQVVNFSISKNCKEIRFINKNKILAMKCEILAIWSRLSINPSLSKLSQIQSPFAPKGPSHMKMN